MEGYIPQKGDYISIELDPQSGHEQKGRRPALVISKTEFNRRTGFAIVCPITRTERKFPFHIRIEGGAAVDGFVMVEQVKSIDFNSRGAKRIGGASDAVLEEALGLLDASIY
jgi:mRNA interferase MazF